MCQNIVRNTRSETLILSLGVFVTLLLLDAVQKSLIFTVSYFSVFRLDSLVHFSFFVRMTPWANPPINEMINDYSKVVADWCRTPLFGRFSASGSTPGSDLRFSPNSPPITSSFPAVFFFVLLPFTSFNCDHSGKLGSKFSLRNTYNRVHVVTL